MPRRGWRRRGSSPTPQIYRSTGGYFDAAAATNPLLHMWTLAVEEQFYLVFPRAAALAWWAARRAGRRPRRTTVARWRRGGRSVRSPCRSACRTAAPAMRELAFYSSPTRAWEFARRRAARPGRRALVGSGRVAGGRLWARSARPAHRVPSPCGRPATAFPGVAALAPVAGTALVIAAGTSATTRERRPVRRPGSCAWATSRTAGTCGTGPYRLRHRALAGSTTARSSRQGSPWAGLVVVPATRGADPAQPVHRRRPCSCRLAAVCVLVPMTAMTFVYASAQQSWWFAAAELDVGPGEGHERGATARLPDRHGGTCHGRVGSAPLHLECRCRRRTGLLNRGLQCGDADRSHVRRGADPRTSRDRSDPQRLSVPRSRHDARPRRSAALQGVRPRTLSWLQRQRHGTVVVAMATDRYVDASRYPSFPVWTVLDPAPERCSRTGRQGRRLLRTAWSTDRATAGRRTPRRHGSHRAALHRLGPARLPHGAGAALALRRRPSGRAGEGRAAGGALGVELRADNVPAPPCSTCARSVPARHLLHGRGR